MRSNIGVEKDCHFLHEITCSVLETCSELYYFVNNHCNAV